MFTYEMSVEKDEFKTTYPQLINTLLPIEVDIVKRLYSVALNGYTQKRKDPYWTQEVKKALKQLGEENGLLVFPELKNGKFQGQWLFDLVWVDAKQNQNGKDFDWKSTRGLKLACESEWSLREDNILEDFLKLTFAYADIRLFIYTNSNIKIGHPILLCKRVSPLSRGFKYVAIGFPKNKEGKIRIDSWIA